MKHNTTITKKTGVAGTAQQPKPITAGPVERTWRRAMKTAFQHKVLHTDFDPPLPFERHPLVGDVDQLARNIPPFVASPPNGMPVQQLLFAPSLDLSQFTAHALEPRAIWSGHAAVSQRKHFPPALGVFLFNDFFSDGASWRGESDEGDQEQCSPIALSLMSNIVRRENGLWLLNCLAVDEESICY